VYTLLPDGNGQATSGMRFGWSGVEVYFPLNRVHVYGGRSGFNHKKS